MNVFLACRAIHFAEKAIAFLREKFDSLPQPLSRSRQLPTSNFVTWEESGIAYAEEYKTRKFNYKSIPRLARLKRAMEEREGLYVGHGAMHFKGIKRCIVSFRLSFSL